MRAWPPVAGRAELLTQDIQLQLTSGNAADDTAEVDADLVVTQGAFTLGEMGISVQDFGATLHSTNDALSLRASGVSGQGELVLQARLLRPFASDREFSAHLEGSGFTLLNTAAAAATISPALDVGFAGGMLELQGVVGLDQAMLDLERLARDVTDGGVSVSRDAVVLLSLIQI